MFLLHINDSKKLYKDSYMRIAQLNLLKKKLLIKAISLTSLKKKKSIKNSILTLNKTKMMNNPFKYVIGISLTSTNTNVYVANVKGDVKFSSSAGFLNISGDQKTKKPGVIIKLLYLIVEKTKFIGNSSIVLVLKNFTEYYISLVLLLLKKYFYIKCVKVYNNKPYNGCRPKKIKRKKRRKLFFK